MLQSDLDAKVTFPNDMVLQGLVRLRYYPDSDPWSVRAGFYVANAEHETQVERSTLMQACNILARAQWFAPEGSLVRFAVGSSYCRFRILDDGGDGTMVDFDVDRQELINFLDQTQALVDYQAEQEALDAVIEQELGKL